MCISQLIIFIFRVYLPNYLFFQYFSLYYQDFIEKAYIKDEKKEKNCEININDEKKNNELKKEIIHLHTENIELNKEIINLGRENNIMNKEMLNLKEDNNKLYKEINYLKEENNKLKNDLQKANKSIQNLKNQQNINNYSNIEELKKEIILKQNEINQLKI